jgi:hypothetical protein
MVAASRLCIGAETVVWPMAQNESSSSDHHHPDSESAETSPNIRERAIALQKKVGELSETFERIEQNLAAAKAGEKGDDSSD